MQVKTLMILSVIIVNYQVRHFLELCLYSVEKALRGLDAEVLVVDNHSADGSVEFLRPLFPRVRFIVNAENAGFARANNQALQQARGDTILFLNPDTILPEDIVPRCLSFFQSTPGIGGLGVRMVDGSGRFLKESRRGFPTPWVAFCKLSGLTALFPRSRVFSAYYLGFLPEQQTHPSPVLSGACLWVRRAVLGEVGAFDDDFFMYAEDIDLSYRLEKAGYVNYYFPDVTIVHFKGESTRKDLRNTRQFYKAMSQFRRKHFSRGLPVLFRAGLEAAIWLRAGLGMIAGRFGAGSATVAGRRPVDATGAGIRRTWLTGDPAEVERLKERLTIPGKRTGARDPQEAEEIIFCEGRGYSFGQGIAALEAGGFKRSHQVAKFHAAGGSCAVGSAYRDTRGEVLLL